MMKKKKHLYERFGCPNNQYKNILKLRTKIVNSLKTHIFLRDIEGENGGLNKTNMKKQNSQSKEVELVR